MATLTFSSQVDMANLPSVWSGSVVYPLYTNSITITDGRNTGIYYGTGFKYSYSGVTAGTLTGYSQTGSDVMNFSVYGLKIAAKTAYNLISAGNIGTLLATALTGNDLITGSASDDVIYGYKGNDTINGGSGADCLEGDEGNDTLNGNDDPDLLVGFAGNDVLNGGDGGDALVGDIGNDVLNGGSGDDYLVGGDGKNTVTGGLGADNFVLGGVKGSIDTFTDFSLSQGDFISLETAYYDAKDVQRNLYINLETETDGTTLKASNFYSAAGATKAHDSNDHIIYNTSTGALYYDQDGTGKIAGFQIAIIGTHEALNYADFFVDQW